MDRTPYNDPEAEAQYQDNAVEGRNAKMAEATVIPLYPPSVVDITKRTSPTSGNNPAQIIQFPGTKKPK